MLRSPHAHARICSVNTSAAIEMPGVIAIYTGKEIASAGLGRMPCLAAKLLPLKRPDGSPMYEPKRLALSEDKVAFVGDYVAFVVAETGAQARDAALERLGQTGVAPRPGVSASAGVGEGSKPCSCTDYSNQYHYSS